MKMQRDPEEPQIYRPDLFRILRIIEAYHQRLKLLQMEILKVNVFLVNIQLNCFK